MNSGLQSKMFLVNEFPKEMIEWQLGVQWQRSAGTPNTTSSDKT